MDRRIAKFHKVSYEQFKKDMFDTFLVEDIAAFGGLAYQVSGEYDSTAIDTAIKNIYNNIKLPKRATTGSAGYDFYAPFEFELKPNETIKIPTGIRCEMNSYWVLECYPRSGLGFKYRLQLNNTVGIVDSDYFFAKNEGHIFAKITNDTNESKTVHLNDGDGFMQGLFVMYGITADDEADGVRTGGFGSTGA